MKKNFDAINDLWNLSFKANKELGVGYLRDQKQNYLNEVGNLIPKGNVSIKVKSDAYNFIENNGATLNIAINDTLYKITSSESFRRYITPDYYTYYLERVR